MSQKQASPASVDSRKWITLEEAAAILKLSNRSAQGLMTRNSIMTLREEKRHYWSRRQVVALAERVNPTKSATVPKAAARRPTSPVDGKCGVCQCNNAHFTGTRNKERIPLCFRCFTEASYTAIRHGQSVRVVTA